MKSNIHNKRLFVNTIILSLCLLLLPIEGFGQRGARKEIKIPDIKGYVTLKCDFHMHTVFSDGTVWPTIRPQEAWREGLDVISITDHIEYQPHKNDIPTQHERPYDIALPTAKNLNILLIKGTEITRDTPPGHHNAIFVSEIDSLEKDDFYDVLKAADDQGSFIFYNHPGWKHPEGKAEWFEFQETIFNNGQLYGIEVVNGRHYCPLAHQWCIDKKLTLIGNTDAHRPIQNDYNFERGEHRTMTLVFAKQRTEKAVKDALFARRTAVWWKNNIIGDEKYLRPLFNESIEIVNPKVTVEGRGGAAVQIHNSSDIDFELVMDGENDLVTVPADITLWSDRTVLLTLRKKAAKAGDDGSKAEVYGRKKITIPFQVKNLMVEPNNGLREDISITVNFEEQVKQ